MVAARPAPPPSSLLVPHDLVSVASARRSLAGDLLRRGVPADSVEDAVLIVSELITNALRHARPLIAGMVRLDWCITDDNRLEVAVTDGGGPTAPSRAQPSISAHGGRGLAIISSLALAWGVRRRADQTTVWAVITLSTPGPGPAITRRGDVPARETRS